MSNASQYNVSISGAVSRWRRTTQQCSRVALACLLFALASVQAFAQGTVMPMPVFLAADANLNPINNAKLCVYAAGTTTPATTYTSSALTTANTNPVRTTANGLATVFLTPGTSYKFILKTAGSDNTCDTGSTVWTRDGISGVPTTSGNAEVLGTAGEALTAGQAAYLSDGSGSKVAGSWYKTDSANPYSSTLPLIGMVPASVSSGAAGTIRLAGQATGLSSLSVGSTYYVSSTAGALTSTAPTNNRRVVGVADSTSSIVLDPNPAVPSVNLADCNGRLTLTTATPITTADVTAATTIYWTPYKGNRCALYDGSAWSSRTFAELSIAVPASTSTMYDVWLIDTAGTLGLELLAWTNDTTRATALTTQDGVLVKTGATTRRYLGSCRTTTVSGQTEDSLAKRFVWNYYNRVRRALRVIETTDSWTYSTATLRQANASTANQLAAVIGVAEVSIDVEAMATGGHSAASGVLAVSIGEDSTTTTATGTLVQGAQATTSAGASGLMAPRARLHKFPAVGYHFYAWLEYSSGATGTFHGDNGSQVYTQGGIHGSIEG